MRKTSSCICLADKGMSTFTLKFIVFFHLCVSMRGSRKFCQSGSNFGNFFLSWWGEEGSNYHYNRAIIGPPAKRNLNAFRWRAHDGPTLNTGLKALWFFRRSGPVLLRNPIFCDFSGGPDPLPPSGSAHGCLSFPMFGCLFLLVTHDVTSRVGLVHLIHLLQPCNHQLSISLQWNI